MLYLLVNGGSNAGEALGHAHSGPVVTGIGLVDAEQIFFLGMTGLSSNATMRIAAKTAWPATGSQKRAADRGAEFPKVSTGLNLHVLSPVTSNPPYTNR